MTDKPKPKPLTKAEWEVIRDGKWEGDEVSGRDLNACMRRVDATMDALFRYRERTRGMFDPGRRNGDLDDTDTIAADLGLE